MSKPPPEFRDKFYLDMDEKIARTGRVILGVFGTKDDDGPSFAYTVGNHIKDLPELLIVGTHDGSCLNDLSQMMIENGRPFLDGEIVRIGGARLPVKVIRAGRAAHSDYTIQAGEYHGHDDYAVMQVLIPDKEGRYAGDAGCQEPYSGFPVLRAG